MTAICVWDLLDHGAASATTTATAMSPIPAALAAAVVLPGAIEPVQVVAAVIVVAGVLLALADAFSGLDRWGRTWRIVGAATGSGLLTVDEPPDRRRRGRPRGDLRRADGAGGRRLPGAVPAAETWRGATSRDCWGGPWWSRMYFVFVIVGAQTGSPVVVQTLVATTPLVRARRGIDPAARLRRRPDRSSPP